MKENENVLYLDKVKKIYGNHTVLEEVNLEIKQGEFVSLIGPSGCGKSTLLRIAMGEEIPSSGEAYIMGSKTDGNIAPEVGIVYQKYSLFPHLKIEDNLRLGLNKLLRDKSIGVKEPGTREEEIKKRFEIDFKEMCTLFRIDELLNKYPHECSGGQQQRASIVQSLLAEPAILFMDEAFGALDIYTKIELKEFMDEFWRKHNTTIIFITHDLNDAVSMGSRVILLSQYYSKEEDMGSKIVYDKETKLDLSPLEKEDLILHIKQEGFDPTYLQEV